MKLKTTDDGYVALSDKKLPLFVAEEGDEHLGLKPGEEIEYDVPRIVGDLKRSNSESAGRRKRIEELERELSELEPYKGLNLEEAKKALETVKNFEAKKLVDAGEVETLKKAWSESYEDKMEKLKSSLNQAIADKEAKISGYEKAINRMIIRSIFDNSRFLADNTLLTPDIAFKSFGDHFVVEYDDKGDPYAKGVYKGEEIYSKQRPGELASPEEAIEVIIERYPNKDRILKGTSSSGAGSGGNAGSGSREEKSLEEIMYPSMKK